MVLYQWAPQRPPLPAVQPCQTRTHGRQTLWRPRMAPLPRPLHAAEDDRPTALDIQSMDTNQLQTALNVAIASEDYALAAQLRNALSSLLGEQPTPSDWRQLGVLDWLAERAERLGFRYPTGASVGSICTKHCVARCLPAMQRVNTAPCEQQFKSARCPSSWTAQIASYALPLAVVRRCRSCCQRSARCPTHLQWTWRTSRCEVAAC